MAMDKLYPATNTPSVTSTSTTLNSEEPCNSARAPCVIEAQ
jgi:hypothetical protein